MKESEIRSGTFGGTLLSMLVVFNTSELLRTAVLAAVGALVSYLTSTFLAYMMRKKPEKQDR